MGLDRSGTKFLLYADCLGADFSHPAMIGRQGIHLKKKELIKYLTDHGYQIDNKTIEEIFDKHDGFAEGLLEYLGAVDIHSYDNSSYEGATHVHNMNLPIPDSGKEKYTVVIDGGSLEHVFNFPIAIKNCMEMLQVGGHFISITPANNLLGHGFYQFSPELFYRIFTQENGFSIIDMFLFEGRKDEKWYSVMDPNKLGERVLLNNARQAYLMILAKKIKTVDIFAQAPQQSDYVKKWNSADMNSRHKMNKKDSLITKVIKNWRRTRFHIPGPKDSPEFFIPFDSKKFRKKTSG